MEKHHSSAWNCQDYLASFDCDKTLKIHAKIIFSRRWLYLQNCTNKTRVPLCMAGTLKCVCVCVGNSWHGLDMVKGSFTLVWWVMDRSHDPRHRAQCFHDTSVFLHRSFSTWPGIDVTVLLPIWLWDQAICHAITGCFFFFLLLFSKRCKCSTSEHTSRRGLAVRFDKEKGTNN